MLLRRDWAYQCVHRVVECNSDSSSIIKMITPFILIKLCCVQVLGSCMYISKKKTGVCGIIHTTMRVIFITFVLLNISLLVFVVKFGFLILLMGDYMSCMQSRIYHQK